MNVKFENPACKNCHQDDDNLGIACEFPLPMDCPLLVKIGKPKTPKGADQHCFPVGTEKLAKGLYF